MAVAAPSVSAAALEVPVPQAPRHHAIIIHLVGAADIRHRQRRRRAAAVVTVVAEVHPVRPPLIRQAAAPGRRHGERCVRAGTHRLRRWLAVMAVPTVKAAWMEVELPQPAVATQR